ncbi:hypothetical protein SAMN04487771_10429 [[Clostridium] aminophilum]|uniref:Uncharacterized protein n=1 Tax=[Clostridium] aminophilum TaxID=1526 RepID=A0A1I0H1M9_9FIRM|nr:hypothetical protein [[Clostridium] aminophilum]SET77469.1 hypothetical protein SAMN04487771_10429 [[Clostridium] aminophilum]
MKRKGITNIKLKHSLMLQSLSPLAFLTIVRNFKFDLPEKHTANQTYIGEFINLNTVLIVVFILCFAWIIAAGFSFVSFIAFKWTDRRMGYQLASYEEKEDASLNFFLTMIIPLLIDDVETMQGALTFFIIVIMMCSLLSRTHLYYANPVLAMLGYNVYEIHFLHNQEFENKKCLCVVRGHLGDSIGSVEYKKIDGNVLYLKEMNR